jgi:hypothetical protein
MRGDGAGICCQLCTTICVKLDLPRRETGGSSRRAESRRHSAVSCVPLRSCAVHAPLSSAAVAVGEHHAPSPTPSALLSSARGLPPATAKLRLIALTPPCTAARGRAPLHSSLLPAASSLAPSLSSDSRLTQEAFPAGTQAASPAAAPFQAGTRVVGGRRAWDAPPSRGRQRHRRGASHDQRARHDPGQQRCRAPRKWRGAGPRRTRTRSSRRGGSRDRVCASAAP